MKGNDVTRPTLRFWSDVSDFMAHHAKYPSVSLSDAAKGYGLNCEITPDGNTKLQTYQSAGHGYGRTEDKGRTTKEWIELINEAEEVRNHYWGA